MSEASEIFSVYSAALTSGAGMALSVSLRLCLMDFRNSSSHKSLKIVKKLSTKGSNFKKAGFETCFLEMIFSTFDS